MLYRFENCGDTCIVGAYNEVARVARKNNREAIVFLNKDNHIVLKDMVVVYRDGQIYSSPLAVMSYITSIKNIDAIKRINEDRTAVFHKDGYSGIIKMWEKILNSPRFELAKKYRTWKTDVVFNGKPYTWEK